MALLEGKRIVVTGIVDRRSIAFSIAERALEEGAEIVLTGFGRARRLTERTAKKLSAETAVLELDINSDEDLAAIQTELASRWGHVDGLVHAIAFAPPDALGGNFLSAPRESAKVAFETSAFSLKALAVALLPLMEGHAAEAEDEEGRQSPVAGRQGGGSVIGLDFDASSAWPSYDWMGVAKAALESVSRYLARDLGAHGVRANLISAGPLRTIAAGGISGFDGLVDRWGEAAPLGWDVDDPVPVADTAMFLLSDLSRAISGEIIHVDGGFAAVGGMAVPEDAAADQAGSEGSSSTADAPG